MYSAVYKRLIGTCLSRPSDLAITSHWTALTAGRESAKPSIAAHVASKNIFSSMMRPAAAQSAALAPQTSRVSCLRREPTGQRRSHSALALSAHGPYRPSQCLVDSRAQSRVTATPPAAVSSDPGTTGSNTADESNRGLVQGDSQQKERRAPQEARSELAARYPHKTFRVVGVSFEGRQDLLAGVRTGDAVMFVKEPSNVHDPNAVSVQTLHGHSMGHIAQKETSQFLQPVSFGRVLSIGPEHWTGNFGLTVDVQPGLPALTVDAPPESLRGQMSLKSHFPPATWDILRRAVYSRASHRCEISGGVGPTWPVNVEPLWSVVDATRTVQLCGIAALAPQVAAVKNLERVSGSWTACDEAASTLCIINGWSEEECSTYLNHIDTQCVIRAQGPAWHLDLSWLKTQHCLDLVK